MTASVVERMEQTLKQDVLREIRQNNGRMLLHDEVETRPGTYEIIPIWEDVAEDEVMTPKELYQSVVNDNFQVDYQRVAIVSLRAFSVRVKLICRRTSKRLCRQRCKSS